MLVDKRSGRLEHLERNDLQVTLFESPYNLADEALPDTVRLYQNE